MVNVGTSNSDRTISLRLQHVVKNLTGSLTDIGASPAANDRLISFNP